MSDDRSQEVVRELENREAMLRDRLLGTLSTLDQRRHDALDWRRQLRARGPKWALVGGAVTALVAVAVVLERRVARARKRQERRHALARMWRHPERIAKGESSSVWTDLGHKLAVALLSALVIAPIESGLKKRVTKER